MPQLAKTEVSGITKVVRINTIQYVKVDIAHQLRYIESEIEMHTKVTTRKTLSSGSRFWQILTLAAAFSLSFMPIASANAQQAELYEGIDISESVKAQVKQYRETYTQFVIDEQYGEAEKTSNQALELLQKVKVSKLYLTLLAEHATLLEIAGKLTQAESFAREEIALRRKIQGDSHPFTLKRIIAHARLLKRLDRLAEAEPLYAEVYATRKETLGAKDSKTLKSLNSYASILQALGRTKEAEPLYAEALRLRREDLGPEDSNTLSSMNNHASVLKTLRRLEEAELLYAEVLRLFRKKHGSKHPYLLAGLDNHASVLVDLGRAKEAEPLFAEGLRLNRAIFGPEDPDTLTAIDSYASVLKTLGRAKEAEPLYAGNLRLRQIVLGPQHPDTLTSMYNYASILSRLDRTNEAEAYYAAVYTAQEKTSVPNSPLLVKNANRYISLLTKKAKNFQQKKKYTEEETIRAQILEIAINSLGEDHPETLAAFNNYAFALQSLGQFFKAEEYYIEALRLYNEPSFGENSFTLTRIIDKYISLLITLNRPTEIEPLLQQLIEEASKLRKQGEYGEEENIRAGIMKIRERTLGEDHPKTLTARNNYATSLFEIDEFAKAEKIYAKTLQSRREVLGTEHPNTLSSIDNYATILIKLNRLTEAETLLEEVLRLRNKKQGETHPDTLYTLASYASLLETSGRKAEALPFYAKALEMRQQVLGKHHPRTIESLSNYGTALHSLGRLKEAEPVLAKALNLWMRVAGGSHPSATQSHLDYADVLIKLGRLSEAEELVSIAISQQRYYFGQDHPKTLNSLRRRANIFALSQRLVEAEKLYNELFVSQELMLGDKHEITIQSQYDLADIRLQIPDLAYHAFEPIQTALSTIEARKSEKGFGVRAEMGRKNINASHPLYSRLFLDAAWAFGPGLTPESKTAGAQQLSADELNDITDKAFLAIQNALTGSAEKAVGEATALRMAETISPKIGILARKRQSLFNQWFVQNTLYTNTLLAETAVAKDKRNALKTSMKRIEVEVKMVNDQLRRDAPDYFGFVYPESLDLGQTKYFLEEGEAILMVLPTKFGTHIMVASDRGIKWVRSDWKQDDINAAVKRLLWDVGATVEVTGLQQAEWSDQGEGAYPYDRKTAFALYNQIIAPVVDHLKGKRHVFIATTGSLSSLPLGILVTERPVGADGDPAALRATQWFADQHALVQIPSLQSLLKLRVTNRGTKNKNPPNSFIGFGDPVLLGASKTRGSGGTRTGRRNTSNGDGAATSAFRGKRTRSGAGIADIKALNQMARLPGTALELEAMRLALKAPKTSLFMAAQASESNFRNADLSGVNILTLATHGLLAGEIRGAAEPGLVFTPPAEASEADDGLLTASEITGLKLNADWVILSACNTAAGDGSEGAPGLSGLARSFFYAGARNLLASHWPVRDDVAAKITVRTIEIKRDNPKLSRAEAFQQAMQEIRNNPSADSEDNTWAHPNAWAPFTLIGDGG